MQGEFVIDPENLKDSMLVLQKALEESMETFVPKDKSKQKFPYNEGVKKSFLTPLTVSE